MGDPSDRFPLPGPSLVAELVVWPAGQPVYRVHNARYGSLDFNASGAGNTRFSPIADARGKTVPTLYGGETFECALMETVFHDVPFTPGFKTYDRNNLDHVRASILSPARDLLLVNLAGKALRKLGISRARLLESDPADYSHTRPWAEALHRQFIKIDGLRWVSRQDDEAHALVLFGNRVKRGDLREVQPPTELADDGKLYLQLLALARVIGILLL